MRPATQVALFRLGTRLYPAAFRRQFAGEVVLTYREMLEAGDAAAARRDLAASIVRQWLSVRRPERRSAQVVVGSVLSGDYPGGRDHMVPGILLLQAALFVVLACTIVVTDSVRPGAKLPRTPSRVHLVR